MAAAMAASPSKGTDRCVIATAVAARTSAADRPASARVNQRDTTPAGYGR